MKTWKLKWVSRRTGLSGCEFIEGDYPRWAEEELWDRIFDGQITHIPPDAIVVAYEEVA